MFGIRLPALRWIRLCARPTAKTGMITVPPRPIVRNDFRGRVWWIGGLMQAIAIGRLDDEIVRLVERFESPTTASP